VNVKLYLLLKGELKDYTVSLGKILITGFKERNWLLVWKRIPELLIGDKKGNKRNPPRVSTTHSTKYLWGWHQIRSLYRERELSKGRFPIPWVLQYWARQTAGINYRNRPNRDEYRVWTKMTFWFSSTYAKIFAEIFAKMNEKCFAKMQGDFCENRKWNFHKNFTKMRIITFYVPIYTCFCHDGTVNFKPAKLNL